MGLFQRFGDIVSANLNDMVDRFEDPEKMLKQAVREMVKHVCMRTNLSRNQAYMLCSLAGNLRVTQLVDGNKGIHMMLAKAHL